MSIDIQSLSIVSFGDTNIEIIDVQTMISLSIAKDASMYYEDADEDFTLTLTHFFIL